MLELGLKMTGSSSSLESRVSPSSQLQQLPSDKRAETSSPATVTATAEARQPARDRTGARKALLQWAQNATKE